jgi:AcrR family transcriptional regulator
MGRPKVNDDVVRQRLLSSALASFEAEGRPALRARLVTERAGTSTAALYELFGGKTELIRAIFFEGFAALDALHDAVPTTGDARRDLVALMASTRAFAVDRPMLFDLMFGRPFDEFEPGPDAAVAGRRIYRRTLRAVESWLHEDGSVTPPLLAAEVIVATHRGLIASELAGILGRSPSSVDRKYRAGVDAVLDGVLALGAAERP